MTARPTVHLCIATGQNLSVKLPAELRGKELSADQLDRHGARLEEFRITNTIDETR